jgi:class 3 adenylate cyclase
VVFNQEASTVAMSLAELYLRLADRPADPADAHAFDDALRRELGARLAVLVVDLSGFTRSTKQHGVLHFLAVHARALRLGRAAIEAVGGELVKSEADNLIAIFDDSPAAAAAARAFHGAARAANADLPPVAHVEPCIGIAWGDVIRLSDDVFGDPVNVAYKLGEDVARPWQILVSDSSVEQMREAGERLSMERAHLMTGVELRYRLLGETRG